MRFDANVATATSYALDVIEGEIPACKYTVLACQRHFEDLKKSNYSDFPFVFDADSAEKACRVVGTASHKKGYWAHRGLLLELEAWQLFQISSVFGWKRKDAGALRFSKSYIEEPRKNGSTTLSNSIKGFFPQVVVIDDAEDIENPDSFNTPAKDDSLLWINATANKNTDGPCYGFRSKVVEMLEGITPNDELFGIIYTIDEGDDWNSAEALRKANPNMGISVSTEYLSNRWHSATKSSGFESNFKNRHLNIWG